MYGNLRNISSGPAILQNGDILPGYSIKNDGKTLVIASAQSADSSFYCLAREEGSPYNSINFGQSGLQIYGEYECFYNMHVEQSFNELSDVR